MAGHWYSFLYGGTLERSSEVTMNRITVTIPDDRLSKLQEIAARFQITPEDLENGGGMGSENGVKSLPLTFSPFCGSYSHGQAP